MAVHDLIALLAATAVLLSSVTAFLTVMIHRRQRKDDE